MVEAYIYSKLVIIIGFGIFYFEDMGQLGQFFLNITGISMISNGSPFADQLTWNSFVNNCFLIIFCNGCLYACSPCYQEILLREQKQHNLCSWQNGFNRMLWCTPCNIKYFAC